MSQSHSNPLALAEEVPVALVFNGISHAVMMASPVHLEDFALGFAVAVECFVHGLRISNPLGFATESCVIV